MAARRAKIEVLESHVYASKEDIENFVIDESKLLNPASASSISENLPPRENEVSCSENFLENEVSVSIADNSVCTKPHEVQSDIVFPILSSASARLNFTTANLTHSHYSQSSSVSIYQL